MSAQETTALLIGCGRCDHSRPIYGGGKRISMKGGIRRSRVKSGRPVPDGQWAKGDLDNMEHLMACKGIDVFHRLNYVEQHEDGCYALGKLDILRKIDAFFKSDKTHFVLYFTGHGAMDGSWVFPVTKRLEEPRIHDTGSVVGGSPASTQTSGVSVDIIEPSNTTKEGVPGITPLTPPVSPNAEAMSSGGKTTNSTEQVSLSRLLSTSYISERPRPAKRWNECVTFEDIVQIWDRRKKGKRDDRFLMLILDCCHSGRWVEIVNEMTIEVLDRDDVVADAVADVHDRRHTQHRRDICAQAACRPLERGMVADNQLSSVFTRAFVAAQNRSCFEKCVLSAIDHMFVLNIVSISCYSKYRSGTPVSSHNGPFDGIQFFDSFDDMYLKS